jgi:hypothetical protein
MKKKILILTILTVVLMILDSHSNISAQAVKWDESYSFDKCNNFQIEIYARNNELMRSGKYQTCYQSKGENFAVRTITDGKGMGIETVIDKQNNVAIQIFGTGGTAKPTYNAGGFKYPGETELKKLDLTPTTETKQILGLNCKKYTYTYKKIFGEVWITDQITISNDLGVFRACKMAALHNTLSVPGFVMEMTTEDARGGKTLMKTLSLMKDEKYIIDLKGVEMSKAINKVNYYVF